MSEELVELVLAETGEKMNDAISAARRDFSKVRTGRASSALVETLQVEAYGVSMPMQQVASFSIPEARLLTITPHDKANVGAVVKAIQQSQLGIAPTEDGTVVRLAFPQLTEERRRDMAKMVSNMAEDFRNQIRGLRRNARKDLEELGKDGISEDDLKWALDKVDDVTRTHESQIDDAQKRKEEELLEV